MIRKAAREHTKTGRKRSIAAHGTTVHTAFQRVREMIVHGRLSPGTWIVEAELTEKLGMSRTPVRGALQMLQREGYVIEQKARSKSRMIVSPLTKEDAAELYSIVGHLDGLAGRQVAALPLEEKKPLLAKMKAINAELEDIAKTRELRGRSIFDLDAELHRLVVEAGAGDRLKQMHNSIKPQTERYWRLYASNISDRMDVIIEEHREIIEAIAVGDADAAERALIQNWVRGCDRLLSLMEANGERGTW